MVMEHTVCVCMCVYVYVYVCVCVHCLKQGLFAMFIFLSFKECCSSQWSIIVFLLCFINTMN